MKIRFYSTLLLFLSGIMAVSAAEYRGLAADKIIRGASSIHYSDNNLLPDYLSFRKGAGIPVEFFQKWANHNFHLSTGSGFQLLNSEKDELGYMHYRYQQTINGIPVQGTMFILHTKNNVIESMNGFILQEIKGITNNAAISENQALTNALNFTKAEKYRWEIPYWENQIRKTSNNITATWYPKGELYWACSEANSVKKDYSLCYRFDIYAEKPLSRKYVFVNANTGKVQFTLDRIHHTDVIATAVTAYSGNREITTDSVVPNLYRLQETGRGLGIETYNLQTGTNYVNTDFTDNDNFWNNINAPLDQYATDAHFGAEMTYDFYYNNFGRNSIDNAGQKLISYVHYDVNFVNAFWDGTEMTYGDGDNIYTPLTSLDIAGHEISHGLTENTSNLNYADESGALNESFSDCMGTAIRFAGKQPATIDWLVGDEIGGTPFRNMADPNQYNNPDTYGGTFWNAPNEVHNNSGVMNFWFYLLTEGGSGTNDIGNTYNVSGLGISAAAAICYRMNALYLTPNSNYAEARYYAIQAAADLYGPCTIEVIATTNAWYAVGVGNEYVASVLSDFTAPIATFCQAPSDVVFVNASNNGTTYLWDFGDGTTSTSVNYALTHTYTTYGQFTVSLIADGGTCGIDTMIKPLFISVDTLNPCIVTLPTSGSASTQTGCNGFLYDSGGPNADYTDNTNSTVTIAPIGASYVTLNFTTFDMENTYDFLTIYDGPTTASPLIGAYTGNTLPNGGIVNSSNGSITLVQTTDQFVTGAGFALSWQCQIVNVVPSTNFTANTTTSCSGNIQFTDLSLNAPTSWLWDFGDGDTSTLRNPLHTYTASGTYTVSLTASNNIGDSTYIQPGYITINIPPAPTANSASTVCAGTSAVITSVGADSLVWFDVPVGGTALGTGTTFNTPILSATSTFYVESEIYGSSQQVGPFDNTIGTGNNYNMNNYRALVFDCTTPIILASVKVFAVGAASRTITLTNSAGIILQTRTVIIPDGESRVILNFNVPAGTDFELGAASGVNLFRNQNGAAYPYTLNGLVSITGNIGGGGGFYYYFYDWEILEQPCISPRTSVTVNVDPAPLAGYSYSPNGYTFSFTDQSSGGTSWHWDFGNGDTSTLQNPVYTFPTAGYYTVTLTTSNGICTGTSFQTLAVGNVGIETVNQNFNINIFPNPATDYLQLQFNNIKTSGNCELKIRNMLGQEVFSKEIKLNTGDQNYQLNLPDLANGVYSLYLQTNNETLVRKIEIE